MKKIKHIIFEDRAASSLTCEPASIFTPPQRILGKPNTLIYLNKLIVNNSKAHLLPVVCTDCCVEYIN